MEGAVGGVGTVRMGSYGNTEGDSDSVAAVEGIGVELPPLCADVVLFLVVHHEQNRSDREPSQQHNRCLWPLEVTG